MVMINALIGRSIRNTGDREKAPEAASAFHKAAVKCTREQAGGTYSIPARLPPLSAFE